MKEIILIGGGGHCKSVIDVIESEGQFEIVGIVDKPDGIRKIHKGDIPLSGGFSFFASFLIILFIYPV